MNPPRVPHVTEKVLRSICVDDETYEHFINWLAYIIQFRKKTGTAWIFHGVPGTGKGVFHEKILIPLLGSDHTPKVTMQIMEEKFNSFAERAIILVIDEAKIDANVSDKIADKIKHMITEETTQIRVMNRNTYEIRSFLNLVIFTNHPNPIPLPQADRRMNIAPAQERAIELSEAEVDLIADELELFAGYLRSYEVDVPRVRRILKNEARERMVRASETTVESFFRALREGDLDFFMGYLRDKPVLTPNNSYVDYERIVKGMAANTGKDYSLTRNDLMTMYQYLQSSAMTPTKFSRLCSIYRINIQPVRVNNRLTRGFVTEWVSKNVDELAQLLEPNVSQMKGVS